MSCETHNFMMLKYYNCSILHLVTVVNLFLCLNYKLDFIVSMHVRGEQNIYEIYMIGYYQSVIPALRAYSSVDKGG